MFLSLDSPFVGKKKLHRRSKTIIVLLNHQKQVKTELSCKKSFSTTKFSNTLQISKKKQSKPNTQRSAQNMSPVRKMTQQIEKLINRQLQGPQLLTYINRGSRIRQQKQTQKLSQKNPQTQDCFKDAYYQKKQDQQIQNYNSSGFRQPQYLTLLKKAQFMNSKSFVPHFNWKQKLNKLKNMGNYGHIYKKPTTKTSQNRFVVHQPATVQIPRDYIMQPSKIDLEQNQYSLSRQQQNLLNRSKKQSCKRCHTTNTDYKQSQSQMQRRDNMTQYDKNFYPKRLSFTKYEAKKSCNTIKKDKQSDRQWKFQPWDARDNAHLAL